MWKLVCCSTWSPASSSAQPWDSGGLFCLLVALDMRGAKSRLTKKGGKSCKGETHNCSDSHRDSATGLILTFAARREPVAHAQWKWNLHTHKHITRSQGWGLWSLKTPPRSPSPFGLFHQYPRRAGSRGGSLLG